MIGIETFELWRCR